MPVKSKVCANSALPDAHAKNVSDVLKALSANATEGLTESQAQEHLLKWGDNGLEGSDDDSIIMVFLQQFTTSITGILAAAAALAYGTSHHVDGTVIVVVIVTNGIIGFLQENKSKNTMEALRKISSPTARLIRESRTTIVPAAVLVPGDLVAIEEGDQVPADMRLVEAVNIAADEALLTGETVPAAKNLDPIDDLQAPLGDRKCMVYKSTIVTRGRGKGIVTSSGMATEIGKIAKNVSGKKNVKTPLQRKMERLTFSLFICSLLLAVVVYGVNGFTFNTESTLYAVSLAVAILPEGIAAVLTVVMALGVKRMAKSRAIVRKLNSLEFLGSVNAICSDKTGTLTCGKMQVRCIQSADELILVSGAGLSLQGKFSRESSTGAAAAASDVSTEELYADPNISRMLRVGLMCNIASISVKKDGDEDKVEATGDPTEISLLVMAAKADITRESVISAHNLEFKYEYEFDSALKRMTSVYSCQKSSSSSPAKKDGQQMQKPQLILNGKPQEHQHIALTKGALERVLDVCTHLRMGDEIVPKTAERVAAIQESMLKIASRGLRVLAMAERVIDDDDIMKSILPASVVNSPALAVEDLSSPSMSRRGSKLILQEGSDEDILVQLAPNPKLLDVPSRKFIESGMVFLGLVGINDPPRAETAPSVAECKQAGITVHMLTGDHPATAQAIAKEVGILPMEYDESKIPASEKLVYIAREFDALTDAEVDALPELPRVVARCSPDTKVKMIRALHRRGHRAAMTGDGVNDAAAIKESDIGVAMGLNGSDVTKSVASLILTDDNFATIVRAVHEGRRIFTNICKSIAHLLSSNVAEVVALVVGLVFRDRDGDSVFPMSPMQVLVLNLFTSSPPALGLGFERAASDTMSLSPDSFSVLFTAELICDTFYYGILMGVLTLANFVITMAVESPSTNSGFDFGYDCNASYNDSCVTVFRARSAAFATLSYLLLLHAFNCVHARQSLFKVRPLQNKKLLWAMVFAAVLTAPTFYIPWINHELFKQGSIDWEWALVFASIIIFVSFSEPYKFFKRRFYAARAFNLKIAEAESVDGPTIAPQQVIVVDSSSASVVEAVDNAPRMSTEMAPAFEKRAGTISHPIADDFLAAM